MILGGRKGKAILTLPGLAYSFAILFALPILVNRGQVSAWNWAVCLSVWIVAVMRTRVVRRTGEWIEVVSLGRRKRLPGSAYLVHLETSVTGNRFSTVQWHLACAKDPLRSLPMGYLGFGLRRGIERAKTALQLPVTLETEVALNAMAVAREATPRIPILGVIGLIVVVVGSAIGMNIASSRTPRGELAIQQCGKDRWVKFNDGYEAIAGDRTEIMRPGVHAVELWIPDRRCWKRKDVTVVAGETVPIRCADLEGAPDCIPGNAPLPESYGPGIKRKSASAK